MPVFFTFPAQFVALLHEEVEQDYAQERDADDTEIV